MNDRKSGARTVTLTAQLALLCTIALGGCATGDSNPYTQVNRSAEGRIQACRSGDIPVPSDSQCLQDDAACYQIDDGTWCTGERGATCPAGSTQVQQGATCPPGTRCFAFSESLTCAIGFQ